MKTVEIVGKNYVGRFERVRTASRGIVADGGLILLSHETVTGQYMIPGGGTEEGEDAAACCVREVAEETGAVIEVGDCVLEIDEYYGNEKYVTYYFTGKVVGVTGLRLTEREKEVGMEPEWVPVRQALGIFAAHARYDGTDEMRRGLYLREFTALAAVFREERTG